MSLANARSWGKGFWMLWIMGISAWLVSVSIPGTNYSSDINGIKSLLAIIAIIAFVTIILKYDLPEIRRSWRMKR